MGNVSYSKQSFLFWLLTSSFFETRKSGNSVLEITEPEKYCVASRNMEDGKFGFLLATGDKKCGTLEGKEDEKCGTLKDNEDGKYEVTEDVKCDIMSHRK